MRYHLDSHFHGTVGVVSLADGVAPRRIERFVSSVHATVPNASLVLLSNTLRCDTAASVSFKAFSSNKLLWRLWMTEAVARAAQWERFISCDSTDLIFQANPFTLMQHSGLYYTLEEPWKTLGDDFYNTPWIECFGGADVWSRLSRTNRIVNGGFIGFTDRLVSIERVLDAAAVEMRRWAQFPKCFNDQGLLNLVIWTRQVIGHEFRSVLNDRHELRDITSSGLWREKSNRVSKVDGLRVVEPSEEDVPAAVVHHGERQLIRGAVAPHNRRTIVYDFSTAPNTHILHTDEYRPYAFDKPDSPQDIAKYCKHLVRPSGPHDNRDWRFCLDTKPAMMRMHVVRQRDAFFDRGVKNLGATFDRKHIFLMSHPNSAPALHLQNIIRYPRLAQALEPYAGESQSHFWFGTCQHVLTLYDVLPASVPIVVAWSPTLARLYRLLSLNASRLVPFDRSYTYFARELYSVMLDPWSRDVQGGEPVSAQSFARLAARLRPPTPPPQTKLKIVLINRRDRGTRRCINHIHLVKALRDALGRDASAVHEFVGSDVSTAEARKIFRDTTLLIAPHGGALLNMVFMRPATAVIEIGYFEENAARYRSMRFPPWFFVLSQHMFLKYSLILASGSYGGDIACPISEIIDEVGRFLHL